MDELQYRFKISEGPRLREIMFVQGCTEPAHRSVHGVFIKHLIFHKSQKDVLVAREGQPG